MTEVKKGDWISFAYSSHYVIDEVVTVLERTPVRNKRAVTMHHGEVGLDKIVEVRSGSR